MRGIKGWTFGLLIDGIYNDAIYRRQWEYKWEYEPRQRDYIYIQHLETDKNRDIFLAQYEPND